jgi:hypothetical protein
VRRALRRKWIVGAGALVLAYHTGTGAAPPKANPPDPTNAPSWVADELRILRSDVESLRQRPDPAALAADVAALRNEVTRLSNAQADLERRLGATPPPLTPTPATTPERSTGGGGVVPALVFLGLGAGLGWVGGRLSQRWRDRRQRIRV